MFVTLGILPNTKTKRKESILMISFYETITGLCFFLVVLNAKTVFTLMHSKET